MSPVRAISTVLLVLALAVLGALAWAVHQVMQPDRGFDLGDAMVLGVLAVFASFCLALAWLLYRVPYAAPPEAVKTPSPRRVTVSQGFATAGGLLLMASVFVPAHGYPVVLLFAGLAALAVSHVLTPCVERLEKLRRARASMVQL
jgi:hypothetical protein